MGSDVSRMVARSHGSPRTKVNIESSYAEDYKRVPPDDITECLLRLTRKYGRHHMAIDSSEFQHVFQGVLANPMEHFSLFDARRKGIVDVLEVFASAYLFSARTPTGIDAKIERVFALFDFDGSKSLNEVEAEIMLDCIVRGTSRVAQLPLPEDVLDSTGKFTASLFHVAKKPLETGGVTVRDVKGWISEREEVSAYLSMFTEARMIISSLELVEKSATRGVSMFMQAAAQDSIGDGAVDGSKVGEILRSLKFMGDREVCAPPQEEQAKEADVAAVELMLTGGSGSGGGQGDRVELEAFKEFVRLWVAFSVVDDQGLGSVSVGDLKALLWLGGGSGGEEPPDATVEKTMNEIDESRDGRVERMEWIRYSTVLDEETGTLEFDGELAKVFRRYDDDRSGSITADEMSMMVRDSVAEAITEDPEGRSLRRGMEAVLETLVQDVARDLVTVMDAAGSGLVGWTEFKRNQHRVASRLSTLREFVRSVALIRGVDASEARRDGCPGSRPGGKDCTSAIGASSSGRREAGVLSG